MSSGEVAYTQTTDDPLALVLESLEKGLHVNLIAGRPLITCGPDDGAAEVFQRPDCAPFDQVPVRDGERIVGVLEKNQAATSTGRVADAMLRLEDRMLLEASTGILEYLHLAVGGAYHLVVSGNRVDGIVTRSDLLKLPVRVVLFTVLTHLETTMASTIKASFQEDEWLQYLTEQRQEKLKGEFKQAKQLNTYADLLSFTQWADKREIISKGILAKQTNKKSDFDKELEELELLRNAVMHSNMDLLSSLIHATQLSSLVKQASYWIKYLSEELKSEG